MKTIRNEIKKTIYNENRGLSRLLSWITILAIFLGTSFVEAHDGLPTIINETTRDVFTDLQLAIDAATPGDTLEINGQCTGNFIVAKDLTLRGHHHAILDGAKSGTVLNTFTPVGATSSVTVTVERVLIRNGFALLLGGGGILNINANLIVKHSRILNNISAFEVGGGISNTTVLTPPAFPAPFALGFVATLTLISSEVGFNQSGTSGGGIANAVGIMEIINSSITSNIAQESGAGIFSFLGINNISDTKIAHNAAVLQGGGMENLAMSLTSLEDVKFIENAAGQAGGLFNGSGGIGASAVSISKTEFHGNNTQTAGGGIFNESGSAVNLTHSRIVKNGAGVGGGIFNEAGAALILNKTEVKKNIPDNIVQL